MDGSYFIPVANRLERKVYELDPNQWVDAVRVRDFVLVDPQADLEIDTTSALGSGGFGRVMVATLKRGGGSTGAYEHETVAVKMLFASNKLSEELLKTFYVEAYQMSQLVHPNIVHLYGACIRPPHLCLVQELAELGRCGRAARSACSRATALRAHRRTQPGQAAGAPALRVAVLDGALEHGGGCGACAGIPAQPRAGAWRREGSQLPGLSGAWRRRRRAAAAAGRAAAAAVHAQDGRLRAERDQGCAEHEPQCARRPAVWRVARAQLARAGDVGRRRGGYGRGGRVRPRLHDVPAGEPL
jgi:hypothetical protein